MTFLKGMKTKRTRRMSPATRSEWMSIWSDSFYHDWCVCLLTSDCPLECDFMGIGKMWRQFRLFCVWCSKQKCPAWLCLFWLCLWHGTAKLDWLVGFFQSCSSDQLPRWFCVCLFDLSSQHYSKVCCWPVYDPVQLGDTTYGCVHMRKLCTFLPGNQSQGDQIVSQLSSTTGRLLHHLL